MRSFGCATQRCWLIRSTRRARMKGQRACLALPAHSCYVCVARSSDRGPAYRRARSWRNIMSRPEPLALRKLVLPTRAQTRRALFLPVSEGSMRVRGVQVCGYEPWLSRQNAVAVVNCACRFSNGRSRHSRCVNVCAPRRGRSAQPPRRTCRTQAFHAAPRGLLRIATARARRHACGHRHLALSYTALPPLALAHGATRAPVAV